MGSAACHFFLTVPSHCMHARIVHACVSWYLYGLEKIEAYIERLKLTLSYRLCALKFED